ncbi:MAG: hypothetical protein J6K55_02675 [Clostridia bacterium]|nr:hypothetical protein [Clostridia bacterium]
MRKRKLVMFWIKLLALCCVLAVTINAVGLLMAGGDDVVRNASALRTLPRNSVDVFFSGTSHMHYNVIPQMLYDDYGITSTMVSGNSVDFAQSYWEIRQAMLTQKPKVIVLDVYPAAAPYCYFYVQNVLGMRATENMSTGTNPYNTGSSMARWLPLGSPYKVPAIAEAYDSFGLEGEAYFEITRFHSRYNELGRYMFQNANGEKRINHNFGYSYGDYVLYEPAVTGIPYSLENAMAANENGSFWTFTEEQLAEVEMLEETKAELIRIIEFAKKKDVQLVLCASPYYTNEAEEKIFDQVGELAAEYGVPFVGLDDSGANETDYFRDLGHLNDDGARVYTEFWGGYLTENFGLEDRRESDDSRYAPWREREGSHEEQRTARQLVRYEGGLTGYLEEVASLDRNHIVLITINGDVYDGFTEDDYWILVDDMGIPEEAIEDWYYTGCGTLDVLLVDGEFILANYEEEGREYDVLRNVDGYDISFTPGRWYINGNSAGNVKESGLNISVYSMIDEFMMDYRVFDLTEMYFEE